MSDEPARTDQTPGTGNANGAHANAFRIVLLVFMIGLTAALFGGVCIFAGMGLMRYASRLDMLEHSSRQDSSPSYQFRGDFRDERDPNRNGYATATNTSNNAQPQIYFMMGGQGAPYGGAPYAGNPYGMTAPAFPPQMPAFGAPDIATEMNQFIVARYQAEFNEFLRQRTTSHPASQMYPTSPDLWRQGIAAYEARPAYISTDIAVPAKLTMEIKRKFSRNAEIEDWLKDEVTTPDIVDPKLAGQGGEPKLEDVLRSLAETTFEDGQYERSTRVYAELAARGTQLSVVDLMRWAKAAELAKDIDSSLRILELVMKNDPQNVNALREAANLAVGAERFGVAADYYLRLTTIEPSEREWRMMRAKTLTWAGHGAEALELMRQLYLEDSLDTELGFMLADVLMSQHDYEDALPIVDDLIRIRPDDTSLLMRKMNAYMAMNKFAEAAEIAARLRQKTPDDQSLLLKQAVNLVAGQKFEAALEPFETYLEEKPEDLDVRKQYAEALMAAGQYIPAAEQYRLILGEEDDLKIRKKLANALMASNEFDEAVPVFYELTAEEPEDSESNLGLVTSLRMSGESREALTVARDYLVCKPYDTKMLAQAAEIAAETGNREQAIRWFRQSLKLDPTNFEARLKLADILIWDEQYEAAESELRRALSYTPNDEKAHRVLARALFYQRKYEQSFKLFKELAWQDPTGVVQEELCFRVAMTENKEIEAVRRLRNLQEMEPEDIAWSSDRYQGLLRQHRFPEARVQARVVLEDDPSHRATIIGTENDIRYNTTSPVSLRAGMQRKTSKTTKNEQDNRRARLTYSNIGLYGEQPITDNVRAYAELDRENFNLREPWVHNIGSYRLNLGAIYRGGHPNLSAQGHLGYRWFNGSDKWAKGEKRSVNDQWLYSLRADMREVAGSPLRVGFFSTRREHYDNWQNVYDGLYAYDFGVDGSYRYRKWDFYGRLQGTVLSDTNSRTDIAANAKYRLYESPRFLFTVGGNAEWYGWSENRPTYYSPKEQWQVGLDLDGRYYWCRDPEVWGSPESYVDFGISIYRDKYENWGQKAYLGVNHSYSKRFSGFARVDFTRETYYNEVKLLAGLTYKFGGCVE